MSGIELSEEEQRELLWKIYELEERVATIDFEFRGGSDLDLERSEERYGDWLFAKSRLMDLHGKRDAFHAAIRQRAELAVIAAAKEAAAMSFDTDAEWRANYYAALQWAAEEATATVVSRDDRGFIRRCAVLAVVAP